MKNILVIGDSHSLIWKYIDHNNLLPNFSFKVIHVDGATSQGVNNPNSKTNALIIFDQVIKKNKNCDYIIISLGEVDCGFAIWYYADKFNVSVNDQLLRSLNAYETFLKNTVLPNFDPKKIILLSSILPTIEDQTNKKFLAGARSEVTTPLIERTKLTIEYNKELCNISQKYNLHYIDITNDILDIESKTVDIKFKNKNPCDHHLNKETASSVYIKHLNQLNL